MKILIITGQLASQTVQETASSIAEILILPVPVASLITPQTLLLGFLSSSFSQNKYDAILVSGFSKFDYSKVEKEIGSPIFLGPKHAGDLKYVIENEVFSKIVPACELIQLQKSEKAQEEVIFFENNSVFSFTIGSASQIPIGHPSRMKILAEIIQADALSPDQLKSEIDFLTSEGADMIDLGFSPEVDDKKISETLKIAKSHTSLPLSIDSCIFNQMRAGIKAGADLVLSLDHALLQEFSNYLKTLALYGKIPLFLSDTAFVVIPDSDTIHDPKEALLSLEKNIVFAQKLGFEKLIADPILSPPGSSLFPSLSNYFLFHQKYPNTPLLFGIGNVTELFDADSVGINALLSSFAHECGASVLFTPDASDKCKGAVKELKKASEMMILSSIRHSSLKDLGIDLLILKEKRKRSELNLPLISKQIEKIGKMEKIENIEKTETGKTENTDFSKIPKPESDSVFESEILLLAGSLNPAFISGTKWGWKPDAAGNFIIGVASASEIVEYLKTFHLIQEEESEILKNVKTPQKRVIVAVHPQRIVIGTDSAFMMEAIINENLITELSHAGYLGRELQKAEIAILLGRSYSQDDVF
ncbi:MAG: DUF4346 domain-containing protein [Methanimicrococcus sp.]|nr:DUF4346 domain-containing protein [Methanimicrococcus sp.]